MIYVVMFLLLPIIANGLASIDRTSLLNHHWKKVFSLLMAILVFALFATINNYVRMRGSYPFSAYKTPLGVIEFIKHVKGKGLLLNDPSLGGILQWELYPDIKIHSDLEMSIFKDSDIYYNLAVYSDPIVFIKAINKYDPVFIMTDIFNDKHKSLIQTNSDYTPVFLDNISVLYVDSKQRPDIAKKYGLLNLDPYEIFELDWEKNIEEKKEILSEIERIHGVYGKIAIINMQLAGFAIVNDDYKKALTYAEMGVGYTIKGDVYLSKKKYAEAIRLYQKALTKKHDVRVEHIYYGLYQAYKFTGKHKKAYKYLSLALNPFNMKANADRICKLARAASAVGKHTRAKALLDLAEIKVKEDDMETINKINEARSWYKE